MLSKERSFLDEAGADTIATDRPLHHHRLAEPGPAFETLRRILRPVAGAARWAERRLSQQLGRHVYPRIPGLSMPYSAQLERGLTVSEATVRLARLPRAFEGLRVLLVTDVHAGPFLRPAALRRAFDRLGSLRPDLILLGGDLVSTRVDDFTPCRAAFRSLRAPLGVFGVLGNHDHYTEDPARLRRAIEACGIELLTNRATALERDGTRLVLAGVDDLNTGRPDLDGAMVEARSLATGREPVVLLSHNPDVFFEAARRGAALVLSGHTHGGQIRLPGLPVLVRLSRHRLDQGRYAWGGSEIVVSRGLGSVGVPLRLACPPEAVLLELRRA